MPRCSDTKADGTPCQAQAIRDSLWCFNHHPDYEEERRRRAKRGGKRGGRGRPIVELSALRDENSEIRRRLLEDDLAPAVAAVAVQSLNTDIRAVTAALKAKEVEELEERITELETLLENQNPMGGRRWG